MDGRPCAILSYGWTQGGPHPLGKPRRSAMVHQILVPPLPITWETQQEAAAAM